MKKVNKTLTSPNFLFLMKIFQQKKKKVEKEKKNHKVKQVISYLFYYYYLFANIKYTLNYINWREREKEIFKFRH